MSKPKLADILHMNGESEAIPALLELSTSYSIDFVNAVLLWNLNKNVERLLHLEHEKRAAR